MTNPPRRGRVFDSVVDSIGNTPLVRLDHLVADVAATVHLKLEYANPGGSVKDRAALGMILDAEERGLLTPGGTIVEGTSGNTGIGLALIGAARGYSTIAVVPDKTSAEKVDLLVALGARVHITPGGRPVGHPEHVRTVAQRLAEEIPGAWLAGQYDNPANPLAHYRTTGPEIWDQTDGRITHFVAGIGTGGTISGAGRFLKEASGGTVGVIGADPTTSVYSGGDGRAYFIESIGHFRHPDTEVDEWPASYHPGVVDRIEQVTDREAIDTALALSAREGLLVGGSGALAVAAALRVARSLSADAVVVALIPDSGRNYLSKYFNPQWRAQWGFGAPAVTPGEKLVGDLLTGPFVGVPATATVGDVAAVGSTLPALPVHLDRSGAPVVAAEIFGTVITGRTSRASDDLAVTALGPVPTFVGIDESVHAVRGRIGASEIVVVTDNGHAVGVLPAQLFA